MKKQETAFEAFFVFFSLGAPVVTGEIVPGASFNLSACPAYSGLADFGLEKTLP